MKKKFKEFEYWTYSMFFLMFAAFGMLFSYLLFTNALLKGIAVGFSLCLVFVSYIVRKIGEE